MSSPRPQYHWYNPAGIFGRDVGVREYRGGIVNTPDGPRVETFGPDGKPKGLGYLSGSMDADLNPGAVQERHHNDQRRRHEAKLEALNTARYNDASRREDRRLDAVETGQNNQLRLALAGLENSAEATRQQTRLMEARLGQEAEQFKTTEGRIAAQMGYGNQIANRHLEMKNLELQANIALQQDEMALKREQLNDLRGSRKLAFIGQAMQALLA